VSNFIVLYWLGFVRELVETKDSRLARLYDRTG